MSDLRGIESRLRARGIRLVAGVDEAGVGALAGPLVAAAVILRADFDRVGVGDSKNLSDRQLAVAHDRIRVEAIAVSVCQTSPGTMLRLGFREAHMSLLRRAALRLDPTPEFVLVDWFGLANVPFPTLRVPKGDAICPSVSAASIVAKVARDTIMRRLHGRYPEYGFDSNHGYSSPAHWAALERLGPSPIHRLTTRRIARMAHRD